MPMGISKRVALRSGIDVAVRPRGEVDWNS